MEYRKNHKLRYRVGLDVLLDTGIKTVLLAAEYKGLAEWFIMGYHIGASGLWMPVLFAPFYGVIYYFFLKPKS